MLVYHYCSLATFQAIVENKTLRLSDITKSNDSAEVVWAAKHINEILMDLYRKDTTALLHNNFPEEQFQEMIDHFYADWFGKEHGVYCLYVICFSKAGDLLSQWRGYADDAAGVAIGVDTNAFYPLCDNGGYFMLNDVIYNEMKQKAFIRKYAMALIKDIKGVVRSTPSDIKRSSMDPFDSLFRKVYRISSFLKSPFFEEEKEHRLVLWDGKDRVSVAGMNLPGGFTLNGLQYLCTGGLLRSYTDMSFSRAAVPLLKEVVLGPKCRAKVTDVQGFLMSNDLYGIQVTRSGGTYR